MDSGFAYLKTLSEGKSPTKSVIPSCHNYSTARFALSSCAVRFFIAARSWRNAALLQLQCARPEKSAAFALRLPRIRQPDRRIKGLCSLQGSSFPMMFSAWGAAANFYEGKANARKAQANLRRTAVTLRPSARRGNNARIRQPDRRIKGLCSRQGLLFPHEMFSALGAAVNFYESKANA